MENEPYQKDEYELLKEFSKDLDIIFYKKRIAELEYEIAFSDYRIKSVTRVLSKVNDMLYPTDIDSNRVRLIGTYISHCLNKLHGNLDGVELGLKKGSSEGEHE